MDKLTSFRKQTIAQSIKNCYNNVTNICAWQWTEKRNRVKWIPDSAACLYMIKERNGDTMSGFKRHTWKRAVSTAVSVAMVIASLGLISAPKGESEAAAADSGYTLVWSDEFEGASLNTDYWTYEYGNGSSGWGNNELQYYTSSSENCYLEDGVLHIVAKQDSTYSGYNYTSTRIKTSGKVSVKYGRVEARLKIPQANGAWPAFWMLGESIGTIGWPYCGEIDIMECVNNESTSYGTAHWDAGGYASYGQSAYVSNMESEYHVYAVEWDSEYIYWYVDDTLYNTIYIGSGTTLEEMHEEYFILLNVAVGGNWPGFTVDSNFYEEMLVDYVRVYQTNEGSISGTGVGSSSSGGSSSDSSAAREGNLLTDTELTNSASNWYGDSSVTFNGNGTASASIGSVSTSDANWTYQLKQDGLTLKNGKWYKAYFTANSSVTRNVQLLLQNNGITWAEYGTSIFNLPANTDTYCELIFQMTEATDTDVLYGIMMGNISGAVGSHTIQISDVGLYEYDSKPSSGSESDTGSGDDGDGTATDGNMLSDTALSNSASDWYGDASVSFNGNGSATSTISGVSTSDANWTYQIKQDGLTLTNGKWYKASFNAKSSVARDIQLLLQNNGITWAVYGSDVFSVAAGTDTYCELIFQMTEATDTDVLFGIMLGNVSGAVGAHTVTISNVSLAEYDSEPASDNENSSGDAKESTEAPAESEPESSDAESSEESGETTVITPSAVTGVSAVYTDGKIQITWDDNGADMYKVVRSDGRTGYANLTYSATAAGWIDSNELVDAQLYYYRVIGYFKDADGSLVMGEMSEAAAVVATDGMPASISNASAVVSGVSVILTWDKAEHARYYKVSRAAGATGKYYSVKYNIEDAAYTDTSLAAGLYRYKVVGYYKDVDGSWVYGDLSDTIYVTVK